MSERSASFPATFFLVWELLRVYRRGTDSDLETSLSGGLKEVGGPGAKDTFLFFRRPEVLLLLSTEERFGSGDGMSLRALPTGIA